MMKTVSWEYQKGTWKFKFGDNEEVVVTKYSIGYTIFQEVNRLQDKWNEMVDNSHLVALDLNADGNTAAMCCHTCNELTTGLLHKETNEITCLKCRQTEVYDAEVK